MSSQETVVVCTTLVEQIEHRFGELPSPRKGSPDSYLLKFLLAWAVEYEQAELGSAVDYVVKRVFGAAFDVSGLRRWYDRRSRSLGVWTERWSPDTKCYACGRRFRKPRKAVDR